MTKNYYALKNVFDLSAIPQDRRAAFAYDVLQAAGQIQQGVPLEKVHGAVTFNDYGQINWSDTGHSNSADLSGLEGDLPEILKTEVAGPKL